MSKNSLKKYINTLDASQLRQLLLDAYSARKETKEYFDFYLDPDSEKLAAKYRAIIEREFKARQGYFKKRPRRSVCKKAISDFKRFSPDGQVLAELMLFYVMEADRWMRMMPRRVSDAFARSVADMLCDTIDLMRAEGILQQHRPAIEVLIDNAGRWGYGHRSLVSDKWEEAQSRSMATLLAGGIEPQQDEKQDGETP